MGNYHFHHRQHPLVWISVHCIWPILSLQFLSVSDGSDGEGELLAHGRGDVALLSKQAQQQVLRVLRPAVDARTLQPDGDMVLEDT